MAADMEGMSFAPIGVLLLVACLIAMLTRRLGLPYIVGLLAAGFLISLLPNSPNLPLSRQLIFNVFLPPLVFEAALQLDWRRFRHELPLTLTLAFAGVVIAAIVVASGMHWIIGWSLMGSALFGVLIAATDPVSVIAAFREMGCLPRVSMVVEAESLLNDGAAAVGFAVLSAIAVGMTPSVASMEVGFLWTLFGGLAIGLAISGAILLVVGRTDDPLVEITLTTIAAYASFLIAERLYASGIISTLAAGLMIGSAGTRFLSRAGPRPGALDVGIFCFPRQQLRIHPDRHECRKPAPAAARFGGGRHSYSPDPRWPRGFGLSAGGPVQLVALAAATGTAAHLVLGRPSRSPRARARPCRADDRS